MLRPILAAATAAALLLPGAARAAADVDACTAFIDAIPAVVDTPGTYCLRKDLATAVTSGSAIRFLTHDVVLDCHGFRVSGAGVPEGSTTYGVSVFEDDRVTVRNCRVSGFSFGISTLGTAALVEDNRVENNRVGIFVNGPIADGEGSVPVIRRNTVIDSVSSAIYVDGPASVTDNLVDGVGNGSPDYSAVGIQAGNLSTGTVIARNVIRNVDSANFPANGVYATSLTNGLIRDNIVIAMPGEGSNAGIVCDGSASVVGNQITGPWNSGVAGCTASDNDVLP